MTSPSCSVQLPEIAQQKLAIMTDQTYSNVKDYYGKQLQTSNDLKTNACCTVGSVKMPTRVREALRSIHPEVDSKYYGCGLVFPEAVEGCRVVDLGSGAGRDCFLLSKLVGSTGFVTGVDMTPEQLEVARKHIDYHMEQFGYSSPNISFLEGYIEDLQGCGIVSESTDIIVSNCVINLCPNKRKALASAFNILKAGGEMYFSDVYADRVIPSEVRGHKQLWGECISGALEWRELMAIAKEVGFAPPVLVNVSPITIDTPELQKIVGELNFCSATYRLFKIDPEEESTRDPLIQVQYKGTIPDYPDSVTLAYNIKITSCCPVLLPASVAQLLMGTRLAPHFSLTPLSGGSSAEQTAPACAEFSEFVNINPFDVLATKTTNTSSLSSCC